MFQFKMPITRNQGRNAQRKSSGFEDLVMKVFEPRHEKTNILHMRKHRCSNCKANKRLCFRYMGSTVPESSTF